MKRVREFYDLRLIKMSKYELDIRIAPVVFEHVTPELVHDLIFVKAYIVLKYWQTILDQLMYWWWYVYLLNSKKWSVSLKA